MKNVLVTGATGGIGEAIATLFAKSGYNVAVHSHTKSQKAKSLADELEKLYSVKTTFVTCDVSNKKEVDEMFDFLERDFGNVDILVNNAGISSVMMMCDTSEDEWDRVLGINLKGMYLCSKRASVNMVHNKWGRIINISSVWGNVGASCEVAYSASKSGSVGFTKALAKELAPSRITVNAVSPGLINTKMNSHLSKLDVQALCDEIPLCRMGEPYEVAHAVLFFAHENASYITAQNLSVDGGWV